MAGQYGNVRRTVRNQPLQQIDKDRGLLLIRGSIPGPSGSLVIVRKAKTKQ
jgi:large subunit ribosomal protein L3